MILKNWQKKKEPDKERQREREELDYWRKMSKDVHYYSTIESLNDLSVPAFKGRFYPETDDTENISQALEESGIPMWVKVYYGEGKIRVVEHYIGSDLFELYLIQYDQEGMFSETIRMN